jgi:tetratricopeptide (TPR) repeat protein
LNAATISLQRLSDAECEELMSNMLGRAALPVHVQARILEAAEGTPLFVEEMLSMLIDDGMLEREDGRWAAAADLTDVPVPPTIQALLAARLDRLGPEERAAIERASVVGKQFHLGAVEALLGDDSPLSARSALMGLVRRDLIGPDRSLLAGDEAFRFRHLLVRDAAYDAIPKATRAELHERFADWLERVAGDRIEEQEEIVGYHLEQVYRLREELGPVDDATSEIGLRAIGRLSSSGRRAAERGDQVAAVSLYRRAVDLCPVGRTDRPRLLFELGIALTEAGVPPDAYSAFDEAVGEAEAAGLTSLHWLARIRRNEVHQLADPLGKSTEEIREELDQAVRVFEAIGDDAALATAWILLAAVEWMPCRFDTAARALGRAVELAGRVGDRRVVEEALGLRLEAQAWGGTAPDQGLEALSAARSKLVTGARFEHIALATEAIYMGMKDELDEARRLMEEVRESAERRGARFWLAAQLEGWGELELYAGELVASERLFREHYELLAEGGDVGHASTGAALLALVLSELHRFGEAEVFARIARETSAADDIASQAMGRSAEARVLSAQGRHDEAISLAREAVRMMEDAEAPGFQAWTLTHCAKVLEAAGHTAEAAEVAREALTLLERKGNVPAARNTRALLDSLGG